MSQTTELLLKIRQQGGEQLTRLQNSLKNLGQQSSATNVNFKELSTELKNIQQTSVQSINNLRGYATAWREIANSVKIGSAEFKQASAEAAKLEAQLQKVQPGGRGRLAAGAQIAGTAAGAAVFGGFEGGAGALIGGLVGGVPGAIVGGGIGAQVGMTRQALGGTATYAADIARQRQALQLVTKDAGEYARALRFIDQTSRELAVPQELITRQFTQLTASVKGTGGNVRDAEKAFIGIASGIRGTGGSLEQLDSALLATSQVFSKGKVSAEELRQQIGERLPGAFSLFAESIGMTPQELDKALEKGQVSLQDFQKFAEELFRQYGDNAKIIADGPDAAGDRLRTSLSRLSESIGTLLKPIGASFQNEMAKVIVAIDGAIKKLNEFFGLGKGRQGEINNLQRILDVTDKRIRQFEALGKLGPIEKGQYDVLVKRKTTTFAQLSALLAAETTASPASPEPVSNLPGITLDSKEKKTKKQKELVDRTKAELDLIKQINAFEREGLSIQAAYADFQLRELEVSLGLERNVIGRNKAIEISQENLTRLYKVADQAFRGFGTEIIKQFDEQAKAQSEIAKTLQDAEIAAGIITEEKAKQLLIDRQIAEFTKKYPQATAEQIERLRTALSTTKEGLTEVQELGKSIIETFATGLGDAFMNLFERAKSFRDILGDILKQTARLLINFGIQAGLKGLFPKMFAMGGIMTPKGPFPLKRYAAGGIAYSPQLAMFGEGSRPEAYVPLPDGRTIPVTVKGGAGGETSVVVNVDAGGTAVEGNDNRGRQLGSAIAAAVQAELIKQKRPGGLLA